MDVGVFPVSPLPKATARSLPHARGGVSEKNIYGEKVKSSSPCTWGCFLVWEFPTYSGSVFPMHVGVFPGGDPHAVFKACLPHARGGVSR